MLYGVTQMVKCSTSWKLIEGTNTSKGLKLLPIPLLLPSHLISQLSRMTVISDRLTSPKHSHTNPQGRLRDHLQSPDWSDLVICKHRKEYGHTWHRRWLCLYWDRVSLNTTKLKTETFVFLVWKNSRNWQKRKFAKWRTQQRCLTCLNDSNKIVVPIPSWTLFYERNFGRARRKENGGYRLTGKLEKEQCNYHIWYNSYNSHLFWNHKW